MDGAGIFDDIHHRGGAVDAALDAVRVVGHVVGEGFSPVVWVVGPEFFDGFPGEPF